MKFNINDNVRVRLTDHGRARYAADQAAFWASIGRHSMPRLIPTEDADGWSTWQLHTLMHAFGQYTTVCEELCFETTIQIVEPTAWAPPPEDPMDAVRALCK